MAENSKLLTAKFVASERVKAGSYSDGQNLYLRVGASGSKSWVFRWHDRHSGKVSELGLGSLNNRGLKEARDKAGELRAAIGNRVDTKDELRELVKPRVETGLPTFKAYAETVIAAKKASSKYKSKKHLDQWTATLTAYAYPAIGHKRPGDITVGDVATILLPLWETKTETATRLRQRIETIIDYALAVEDSDSGNPAKWSERLKIRLGGEAEKNVQHHRAVPYRDVPALMDKLRVKDSTSALLLRFAILCASRSDEARGALWKEFNLDQRMWAIPASRMKSKKLPHRVPLSDEAIAILALMAARRAEGQELVFPGERGTKLSDVAVAKTLRLAYPRANEDERHFTPHGTARSSFRDWIANETNYPTEVAEWALAHIQADKVKAAYQRNDLFEKRVPLMAAWSNYLAGVNSKDNVVGFPASKSA